MIDTVQLAQAEPLPAAWELLKRGFKYKKGKFGTHKWINNETNLNLTWSLVPFSGGKTVLYAEGSLPKLLFGNNVEELRPDNLHDAVLKFQSIVSETVGRKFNAFNATVSRVDYCRNPKLKSNRDVAIWNKALRDRSVSRFRTLPFDFDGVYFRNKGQKLLRETCCYSKFTEATVNAEPEEVQKAAEGIYRVEPRFRSNAIKSFAKRAGIKSVTAADLLTPAASEFAIKETANLLGLNKPLVNASTREAHLIDLFGLEKAAKLNGYLNFREKFGVEYMKLEYAPATFYRTEKLIRDSGVLSITESAELPPLIVTN